MTTLATLRAENSALRKALEECAASYYGYFGGANISFTAEAHRRKEIAEAALKSTEQEQNK